MAKLTANDVNVVENKSRNRTRPGYRGGRRSGPTWREYESKTRIYFFHEGETILQNLSERRNRPVALYREVLFAQFPQYKGRVRWSQTAGCSCGCSPAFILDTTEYADEGHFPIDRFITLSM